MWRWRQHVGNFVYIWWNVLCRLHLGYSFLFHGQTCKLSICPWQGRSMKTQKLCNVAMGRSLEFADQIWGRSCKCARRTLWRKSTCKWQQEALLFVWTCYKCLPNFTHLSEQGLLCCSFVGGSIKPSFHTQTQDSRQITNSSTSDVCAQFSEFPGVPSPSKTALCLFSEHANCLPRHGNTVPWKLRRFAIWHREGRVLLTKFEVDLFNLGRGVRKSKHM